jgi:hypothetical protein
VGITGSGKTTLVKRLIRSIPGSIVILDTKAVGDFAGWGRVAHDGGAVLRAKEPFHLVLQPRVPWTWRTVDRDLTQAVYRRGRLTLVVDEALNLCGPGYIGDWLRMCLVSGRGRGIRVVALSQSLTGLHNDVIRQSAWALLARNNEEKLRAVTGIGAADAAILASLPKYRFAIWLREEGTLRVLEPGRSPGAGAQRRAAGDGGAARRGGVGGSPRGEAQAKHPLPAGAGGAPGGRLPRLGRFLPGGAR